MKAKRIETNRMKWQRRERKEGSKNDSRIETKMACTMKAKAKAKTKTNEVNWIELNWIDLDRILASLYILSSNQKQEQITINIMTIKGNTKGKKSRKNQSNRMNHFPTRILILWLTLQSRAQVDLVRNKNGFNANSTILGICNFCFVLFVILWSNKLLIVVIIIVIELIV